GRAPDGAPDPGHHPARAGRRAAVRQAAARRQGDHRPRRGRQGQPQVRGRTRGCGDLGSGSTLPRPGEVSMKSTTLLAAWLAGISIPVAAQENASARALAATCASCHGTEGLSATREVIPLAGLPKEFIVAQMKAFRDGTRQATIMQQLAKGYTERQVELIAGYFAARK